MTIAEKVQQTMRSKELNHAEKQEQLRALIPANVFKIDNLSEATPAQLKQLQEALEVAEALQQLNAALLKEK